MSLADAGPDPEYLNAAITAARLGMPDGAPWLSLRTVTEVRQADGPIQMVVKLSTLTVPDAAFSLAVSYRHLRACEGFAVKMVGACVQEPTPTCWAITLPATYEGRELGGYIVVEPWLVEVPIRVPQPPRSGSSEPGDPLVAVALRQRWPDGQIKRWVQPLDDMSRLDDALRDRAVAALDLRVRTGRPLRSGAYRDEAQLREVIDPIVRELRKTHQRPTVERVAQMMSGAVDPKVLSRWVHTLVRMDWAGYLDTVS